MPRAPSENTVSITIKMPQRWVDLASELADLANKSASSDELRMAGRLTRTEVLRLSLERGLNHFSAGYLGAQEKRSTGARRSRGTPKKRRASK